ncbi:Leucine rich repeat containing protein BspA family protein [Entamoeba marina]
MNNKQLDSYSLLIVSKYLLSSQDFINVTCVCKKFEETTEKLRFNPIPITSLKLFPKIQTQYLYSKNDKKIEGIDNYEMWYEINYDQYLQLKENNIKFHFVIYTHENMLNFGDFIPAGVTIIGRECFGRKSNGWSYDESYVRSIDIPSNIMSLKEGCFNYCSYLMSITLPSTLTILADMSFYNCSSLNSINLPSTITSLGDKCFYNCVSLKSINLPSSLQKIRHWCFRNCQALTSINIPSSLTSLGDGCFINCSSLTTMNLPNTITLFGISCFHGCSCLKRNNNIPSKCYADLPSWMIEYYSFF